MAFETASEIALIRGIVLDSMADGAIAIDRKQNIIYCNRALLRKSGYSYESLMGQPVHVLVPEDIRERHVSHITGFTENPEQRNMLHAAELPMQCADGTIVNARIALGYDRHPVHGLVMIATLRWV